jgi:hypothetical protein
MYLENRISLALTAALLLMISRCIAQCPIEIHANQPDGMHHIVQSTTWGQGNCQVYELFARVQVDSGGGV